MSYFYNNEEKNEINERVAKKIKIRKKLGEKFSKVITKTKRGNPAKKFWGKSWCENLDKYSQDFYRISQGKSYLRKGNVYDLDIKKGSVYSTVTGADIYDVKIDIKTISSDKFDEIKKFCHKKNTSKINLMMGDLDHDLLKHIADKKNGIFPESHEISFNCTCPDYENICKHVSAVLYAIGVELDSNPDLFFKLRNINTKSLITSKLAKQSEDTLQANEKDIETIFDIELD